MVYVNKQLSDKTPSLEMQTFLPIRSEVEVKHSAILIRVTTRIIPSGTVSERVVQSFEEFSPGVRL